MDKNIGNAEVSRQAGLSNRLSITVTGKAAEALFGVAAIDSEDIEHYDNGSTTVYKKDLACNVERTQKSSTYSCTIILEDGKAILAPRG